MVAQDPDGLASESTVVSTFSAALLQVVIRCLLVRRPRVMARLDRDGLERELAGMRRSCATARVVVP